ncbi:son of sevenless homolog 2 [Parasteatoda tepidariorum]|uniref:son of sevenless homolog 2 n=1 Tax=Parasteatoda tepidariorum TaxID=114398 RepID=UPI00077FB6F6|nr:son of sevenless homolog 2 isoform X1 [Parasteatoda tepidariorum]XP_042901359.1 son of sevenless homolog 2 isoform X2 [Parasteatoda tepidariorum]XP_042901361.1 son of sevenless homolog 2 isoform X1 [Parasteatoda tepidariorum]XP_042901362.1 son of sevenless homolog 2 isoform X1 [Parasteatoda tepidariorum]
MFASSRDADQIYDFDNEENSGKWKNLLINALGKVRFQVHPSLNAKDDALRYVETLIFRLLGMLCAAQPHTVQDVEERVQKTFPHPIDKWAIGDAQSAIEKGKKKSPLVLPVEKIHPLIQKEILGYKVDLQVTQYIVAVLEYISADILKLAGNYVKNIRHVEITCQDIKVAMCADKVLMDMFYQDDDVALSIEDEPIQRKSLTYDEVVKDLIHEEKQYIRYLNMIIKVFREPFVKILEEKSKELDTIFTNICEIYDFSVTLLGTFEDALEMAEENSSPSLGACYEELAESYEFDIYYRYAHDILMPASRENLMSLLHQPHVRHALQSAGHGFIQAVKYVLPKLLLGPVFHCFQYFDYLKVLKKLSPSSEDQESLQQAEGVFTRLRAQLEELCSPILPKRKQGEAFSRMYCKNNRQASIQKMNDLQKSIDGWEGKDIGQCCNEFVMEGILGKVGSGGRRLTERQVFLLDGLMILCKPNNKRSSVTGPVAEYRLKEKYYLRKIEILDKEDSDELKNAFEIAPRDQLHIILFAKTSEEKNNWMANLIMLNTRSMLERTLDSILLDEEKKHPLRLPNPEDYRFAVEDSESNIIFEENKSNVSVPIIKGATLLKLVERLTYHMYADPMFVRTFLTTYRSFCQPQELLDLLIERFKIVDPPPPPVLLDTTLNDSVIESHKNSYSQDIKRFKKEYCQPVQFRVLNVLRHWVDHHFYDFERDHILLSALQSFLDKVEYKSMRKWVESIKKIINRRLEPVEDSREITFTFEKTPPPIEWFLSNTYEKFDLITLHPIELARQLTLLEFELYRGVKPSELVGSVWTKKDKMKTSPNLLKMIHHSSNFSFWLMKCIVETENFEERLAVVSRVLEIMMVLQDLNNFTGVLEVVGAMNSACVHRLEHTLNNIKYSLKKSLEEAQELNSDHFKKYQEKLRSINPPCVPFFGMYLTNILHIEEGNPDFIPNVEGLINFSKRRKVAEITAEIQQYQNQPYCLTTQPDIKRYLENLDPLEGRTEKAFNDYLYNKSLEIEPRNCKQPPKFPRKWPDLPLKSPGIKPRLSRSGHHPTSLPSDSRGFSISSTHINQDDEDAQSFVITPPNPSTPLTPPYSASGFNSDHSIFAPVMIGGGNIAIPETSGCYPPSPSFFSSSLPASLPPPLPLPPSLPPPPLPPRRKRESSVSESSPCTKQATDAPLLPPRETSPPPLPPRRDLTSGSGTLPRMHSASNFPPVHRPSNSAWSSTDVTLPRRNSALDVANFPLNAPRRLSQSSLNDAPQSSPSSSHFPLSSIPVPHHTSVGVLDSAIALMPPPSHTTPQLPPKTHRQTLLMNNHAPR